MNTDFLFGAANLLVVGPYTIRAAGRERATWWRYGLYGAGVLAMVSGAAALRRAAASSGNTSSIAGLGAGNVAPMVIQPPPIPDGYSTWRDYYQAQVASGALTQARANLLIAQAESMQRRYEEANRLTIANQAAAPPSAWTPAAPSSSASVGTTSTAPAYARYGTPASELVAAAAEATAAKAAAAMAPAGGSVIDVSIPESPPAPPAPASLSSPPSAVAPAEAASSGPLVMNAGAVLGQGGAWLLLAGIAYAAFSSRSSAPPQPRRRRARR